jgi:hypothetical protein
MPLAVHSLIAWQQLVDTYADAHVRVEDFGSDMTAASAIFASMVQGERRANLSSAPRAPLLANYRNQQHQEYSMQHILAVAPESANYFRKKFVTVNGPLTPYSF